VSYIAQEPVRFWAAITGVIVAVIPLLTLFGVIELSSDQVSGILAVLVALGVLFQFFFVREKVTPV
jgi:uncharacterized membrane protein